jgi:hypothetical protein
MTQDGQLLIREEESGTGDRTEERKTRAGYGSCRACDCKGYVDSGWMVWAGTCNCKHHFSIHND